MNSVSIYNLLKLNLTISKILLAVFIFMLSFIQSGCQKMDSTQKETDDGIIKSYLQKKNITAIKTSSGLYYSIEIDTLPKGKQVSPNSSLIVKYKGYLPNDSIFDQNLNGTAINLTTTIKGWSEGLPKFKVGEKGSLFIPSHLGYGENSTNKIPSNSVLIFDIEIIEN
jgi:FKBP-type peptidyl-prolyl cis-trans isomerase FkpA